MCRITLQDVQGDERPEQHGGRTSAIPCSAGKQVKIISELTASQTPETAGEDDTEPVGEFRSYTLPVHPDLA